MKATAVLMVALATMQLAAADSITGEYMARIPEVGSGLLLRADQSFEYFFTYGAADYAAKGTWRRDKDAIVLTTSGNEEKPFQLVASENGTPGVVRVFVQGPNGAGVANIDVAVVTADGRLEERTSQEGVATFEVKGPATSVLLHVPVYDIEAGPFAVPAGKNDLRFQINGQAITTVRFRDERLRLVNGGLEMTFWKGDKPLVYRKR